MKEPEDMKTFLAHLAETSKEMDKLERRHRRVFRWHWQNLYKEDTKPQSKWMGWRNGRAWLYMGRAVLGCQWVIPTSSFALSFETDDGEHQISAHIACGLFAFYFHLEGVRWLYKYIQEREISFSVYDWSLHWRLWVKPHEWSKKTPRWRDGYFHINDFFLGKAKYSSDVDHVQQVLLLFDEGTYPATVTLTTDQWKRPRWPWPLIVKRGEVAVENGVPVPGKGENSWDCGEDATFSLLTPANTVEEAVQKFLDSVNRTRKRYGGEGWLPEKVK